MLSNHDTNAFLEMQRDEVFRWLENAAGSEYDMFAGTPEAIAIDLKNGTGTTCPLEFLKHCIVEWRGTNAHRADSFLGALHPLHNTPTTKADRP
jgi:hypothetical protein